MPGITDELDRNAIRALSIRQPYCHQILHEGKDIENRSRRSHYRGWFLIHASGTINADNRAIIREKDLPTGGFVGLAKLVDCVDHSDSRWFMRKEGNRGFVLEDAMPLKQPIPYKGTLGFFKIDDEAWTQLLAALE